MRTSDTRGFTLIELAIVITIMGTLLAMSVPAVGRFTAGQQLKGATENVAAQLRLARAKAVATDSDVTFHVNPGYQSSDYHTHRGGVIAGKWKLPRGVTFPQYSGSPIGVILRKDGTSSGSLTLALTNTRGERDTVSVLVSGLVLTR